MNGFEGSANSGGYRPATPNSRYTCLLDAFDTAQAGRQGFSFGVLGWYDKNFLPEADCCLCHRGQYSDAVLSELESQNDQHIEGMTAKVRMLKEVCTSYSIYSSMADSLVHCLTWFDILMVA